MNELQDLYQEVILDHNKNPRNFKKITDADRKAEGYNPLCGDRINVYLKLEDDKICDIAFEGSGCAISKSSASMMTTLLKGKTVDEAEKLFDKFHKLVTSKIGADQDTEGLEKLAVFSGVRDFPIRVKCASLAWHTMHAALNQLEKVSTE